jgi:hypothetical protein
MRFKGKVMNRDIVLTLINILGISFGTIAITQGTSIASTVLGIIGIGCCSVSQILIVIKYKERNG